MNFQEIGHRLRLLGVDLQDVINTNIDLIESDKYHLISSAGIWQVYYAEREHQWDYRQFTIESDACDYLWSLLEKDEAVWSLAKNDNS